MANKVIHTENLTNPGADPVEGDLLKDYYQKGQTVTYTYHEPEPEPVVITTTVLVEIIDPKGENPPGLINDNTDEVTISATLKDADGNVLPINDKFRIPLRDDSDLIYEIVKVKFQSGVASFNYKTSLRSAYVHLAATELHIPDFPEMKFEVEGDNLLVVYSDFSN